MSLLQARITNAEREKQDAEQAETRKSLVGSGDRSGPSPTTVSTSLYTSWMR